MDRTSIWSPAVALVCTVATSSAALAQDVSSREGGSVLFGAFITDRDTTARLDSASGVGTDIDLEEDLGLESSMSVARVGGYYWFTPRHRFDAAYFELNRSVTNPIQETIHFGDRTFTIDTAIETESDLQVLKADYTFAALTRERGFLGVTGGLYVSQTMLSLSAPVLGELVSESSDITAPLPVFGLRGDYAITDRFTLRGAAQWFGIETEDTDGTLRDFYVGADYAFGRRMAIGLAYNKVSMSIEAEERFGFQSRLDWSYDGALLYFKLSFGT
jgi:hypothetical protein